MKQRHFTRTRRLAAFAALCVAIALPASAAKDDECSDATPFQCLADHTASELKRLGIQPTEDQAASFQALPHFALYLKDGPQAAVEQWEAEDLPVYDLVLTLLLAGKDESAERAALAATKPFAFDADGAKIKGKPGFAQMRQDVASFYHGEENMTYARACVSDEAFKELIGGGPKLREGACRAPYDTRSVQRAFGLMQLLKNKSRAEAVEASMQYAYRVPSCTVARAIIDIADAPEALGGNEETASWKILDMATICAAELLGGQDL